MADHQHTFEALRAINIHWPSWMSYLKTTMNMQLTIIIQRNLFLNRLPATVNDFRTQSSSKTSLDQIDTCDIIFNYFSSLCCIKLMTHKRKNRPTTADFSRLILSADKNRLISWHAHNFFGEFFGWGLNRADSDDEVAAAFLDPVAWINVT